MDYLNKFTGGDKAQSQNEQGSSSSSNQQSGEGGGFLSGLSNKLNSAAGGGKESEKNEDYLDKGGSPFLSFPFLPLSQPPPYLACPVRL